jgi:hypothetical protein
MWVFIVLTVLFILALGVGGWGRSHSAYWRWSPAAVILVVAAVLLLTGHLSWQG